MIALSMGSTPKGFRSGLLGRMAREVIELVTADLISRDRFGDTFAQAGSGSRRCMQMYCGVIALGRGLEFGTRTGGILAVEDRPATQSAPCSAFTSSSCIWCRRPAGGRRRAQAIPHEEGSRAIGSRHCFRDAWTSLEQASGFQYAQIVARRMKSAARTPAASRSAPIGGGPVELLGRTVIPRAGASTTASWLRSIKRLSR